MIELLLQAEGALSVGLLDRAEALYRQVTNADPRNSIAVVGLARVALERRDDAGALSLAREALAIDPENTAAQRMVERLEEVLRYRGDDLPTGSPTVASRHATIAPTGPVAPPGLAPPSSRPEPPGTSVPEPPSPKRPAPTAAGEDPRRHSFVDRLLRRR